MSVTTSFGVTNCKCLKLDTLPVEVEGQEVGQGCTEVEGHDMDVLFVEPMASRLRSGSIVRILPPWWVLNKTLSIIQVIIFLYLSFGSGLGNSLSCLPVV